MVSSIPNITTISELLDHYFVTDNDAELQKFVQLAEDGILDMGKIWQKILAQYLVESDSAWRDYTDFSDAKFATICNYESNNYSVAQATVSVTNKIGWLRVCLWNKWKHNIHTRDTKSFQFYPNKQNVFFMLIPYYWYKGRKNIKINCDPYSNDPKGAWYNDHKCSFSEVIQPVDSSEAQNLYEQLLKTKTAAEIHMA